MEFSLSSQKSHRGAPAPGCGAGARSDHGSALALLLVTRNADWSRAVHGAAAEINGSDVLACAARDAISRLAGSASRYSHVLVDRNGADGLFDALADLATEAACPDTDMLALGKSGASRPRIREIPTATAGSVREALMASAEPRDTQSFNLSELRAALDGAMIETRYQPIIRIADRQPVGLEALARLNHPEQGTLLPDRFVPQIEDAGLAADLTRIVSERAFTDLSGAFLAGRGLRMSINFPLDVILKDAALDMLEDQRSKFGLRAEHVIIELTESRPVNDTSLLRRSLERLRALGYGVAIDDVGPAVPRLEPLLDLPFSSLKLDKDLVQQALASTNTSNFLAATIAQAKARGLTVVAEGVETIEIWDKMRALGADEAQGFLAARPLPVAAVPIWWSSWLGHEQSA